MSNHHRCWCERFPQPAQGTLDWLHVQAERALRQIAADSQRYLTVMARRQTLLGVTSSTQPQLVEGQMPLLLEDGFRQPPIMEWVQPKELVRR